MKAIAPFRLRLAASSILSVALAACASTPPPAPPTPPPAPAPTAAPVPPPPPAPRPAADWRDAALSTGTWTWSSQGGRSTASFGQPGAPVLVELQCDRSAGLVRLSHTGRMTGPVPLALVTTFGTYPLEGLADPAAPDRIVATIPVRDRKLDAMAHSRGRFAVEVAGLTPSYLPSWPEVSRVVEDCR